MNCNRCKYHEAIDDGFVIEFCECKHPLDEELDFHYDYCPSATDNNEDCPYFEI